jgi:cysteine desulfurase
MGRQAARVLDAARRDIAGCLGGGFRPADVTWTSGGTESNNLALLGLAEAARAAARGRTKVVLSSIEHDSVLDVAPRLRALGFDVVLAPVGRNGRVSLDALAEIVDKSTALVSIMSANNETGIIQPLADAARLAHAAGAIMHTDAVQAFGRVPLDLAEVDAVSIAAHKIGGPVGCGALVCRSRTRLAPLLSGGGQERGRRAGTQDVRGAVAFAAAARACHEALESRRTQTTAKAQRLYQRLCNDSTGIVPSVAFDSVGWQQRLPGIVSILVAGVDSETLVLECDQAGYEVSAASACSSGSLDASHVLLAMGVPRELALCSLRISFDERVEARELDDFAEELLRIVPRRRGASAGSGRQETH